MGIQTQIICCKASSFSINIKAHVYNIPICLWSSVKFSNPVWPTSRSVCPLLNSTKSYFDHLRTGISNVLCQSTCCSRSLLCGFVCASKDQCSALRFSGSCQAQCEQESHKRFCSVKRENLRRMRFSCTVILGDKFDLFKTVDKIVPLKLNLSPQGTGQLRCIKERRKRAMRSQI